MRSGRWVPAAVLVLVPLLLFLPMFWDQVLEARDFPRWTWPSRALWRAAVLEGRLPQWNPFVGLGAALTAAPVHGVFYPGHLLLLLGPPVLALSLTWVAHVVLAGGGGFLLARAVGCGAPAALASALVWQAGGYAVSMWGNGEKVLSGAWIPWAALGLMRALGGGEPGQGQRAARVRGMVGAAVALALMALAGDPFLWFHAALLGGAAAWAAGGEGRVTWRGAGRVVATGAACVLVAVLLAGPALVPAMALVGDTERAGGLARGVAEAWSFQPGRIVELVSPAAAGTHIGQWAPSVYLGAAVALGALAALVSPPRTRVVLALAAVAVLGLLLALGSHTPVHGGLRALFPPLAYMRYPEKHLLVTVGALALLGGLGFERLGGLSGRRLGAMAAALIGAVAVWVLASGGSVARAGWMALVVAAAAGVAAAARRAPRWQWLLPAVVAADLMVAAMPRLRWVDAGVLLAPPPALALALATRAPGQPPPRLYHPPAVGGALATVAENMAVPWGIAHVPGHESAQSARLHRLWETLSPRGQRATELLGIEWLILPAGAWVPGAELLAPPLAGGEAVVARLPAPPRLRLVDRVRVLDDGAALAALSAPAFDPAREAVVAPGPEARALAGGGVDGQCRYLSFASERVDIQCRIAGGGGLLVIAEAHARGWQALVGGAAVGIARANVAERGIYLAAGEHHIELRYRTPGLGAGLALAGVGLALIAALLLLLLVRRRDATR